MRQRQVGLATFLALDVSDFFTPFCAIPPKSVGFFYTLHVQPGVRGPETRRKGGIDKVGTILAWNITSAPFGAVLGDAGKVAMRKALLGSTSAFVMAIAFAGPSYAGNIVLTGHDNDFHRSANAQAAAAGSLALVRAGSSLPVLTFDAGSELQSLLTLLAIPFVNVDPSVAANVTDALFDHTVYSAFAVASVTSCGGCDNTPAAIDNIVAHSAAIASFFNDGGGIYGLAGAADPGAYDYVPEAATNGGGSPSSTGYVQTADGLALGITPVNGDATHNFFNEPGTGGLSPLYKVVERFGDPVTGIPETIALVGGTIICTGEDCVIVTPPGAPEPGTLALLGTGLAGLGAAMRRRRKKAQA